MLVTNLEREELTARFPSAVWCYSCLVISHYRGIDVGLKEGFSVHCNSHPTLTPSLIIDVGTATRLHCVMGQDSSSRPWAQTVTIVSCYALTCILWFSPIQNVPGWEAIIMPLSSGLWICIINDLFQFLSTSIKLYD